MKEKGMDGGVALRYEIPELRVLRVSRGSLIVVASSLTGVTPNEGYGIFGFGNWACGVNGKALEGYGNDGLFGNWGCGVNGSCGGSEGYIDGGMGSWD